MIDDEAVAVLLTRFTWIGAAISFVVWAAALVQVWRVEGSRHHLVARVLSIFTMLGLDIVVVLIFWPPQLNPPPIDLSQNDIRILVAFIVGMQVMAAFWQITAPKQGRVRRDGSRW